VRALWQQSERRAAGAPDAAPDLLTGERAQGFEPVLPAAVRTVQFVFEGGGLRCCLAVDREDAESPPIFDPTTGRRRLVLSDLPAGGAVLSILGFPSATAPAPSGFGAVCATNPTGSGRACDGPAFANPSFRSAATQVEVVAAQRSPVTDVVIPAVPFLVPGSSNPEPEGDADNPVSVSFTVADAVSDIDADSIQVTLDPAGDPFGGAASRTPCSDFSSTPCSPEGQLGVFGIVASEPARALPAGAASVRIRAATLDDPPRTLDVAYDFDVLTEAPSPTPSVAPSPTATATRTATTSPVVATPTATPTQRPTDTPLTPTETPTVATPTNTPTVATPTNTVTPTTANVALAIQVAVEDELPILRAVLERTNGAVVGIQNDIGFSPSAPIITGEGSPLCTVNPALDKNDGGFAFTPPGCIRGKTCTGIRAAVVSFDDETPISAGTVLYTCRIETTDAAFTCSNAKFSPPAPAPVPAPNAECVVRGAS
jgi:hypothetical protein